MSKVRRHPLWKNCLDNMRKLGVEFGKRFEIAFFEAELSEPAQSVRFGVDVSKIRRELEKDGFHLSGQGLKGEGFEIIPAAENRDVMARYLRESKDKTKRAVILGSNTPMDALTESERTRHEQILERAQMRQALIGKEKSITRYIQKTAPNMLKAIDEENNS